jgi:hypothetical protein
MLSIAVFIAINGFIRPPVFSGPFLGFAEGLCYYPLVGANHPANGEVSGSAALLLKKTGQAAAPLHNLPQFIGETPRREVVASLCNLILVAHHLPLLF